MTTFIANCPALPARPLPIPLPAPVTTATFPAYSIAALPWLALDARRNLAYKAPNRNDGLSRNQYRVGNGKPAETSGQLPLLTPRLLLFAAGAAAERGRLRGVESLRQAGADAGGTRQRRRRSRRARGARRHQGDRRRHREDQLSDRAARAADAQAPAQGQAPSCRPGRRNSRFEPAAQRWFEHRRREALKCAVPVVPHGAHAMVRAPENRTSTVMNYIVGVDIGGTFTDCAVFDPARGSFTTAKAPTTPSNPAEGFFNALENAAAGLDLDSREFLARTRILVNATTTATNAIVTKRGARLGLLTTAGHGQSLFIMNGSGRSKGLGVDELLYMAGSEKPRPLVSRDYIEEITERVDCKGEVVVRLDEAQAREAIERLVAKGIDALAICLLWSFQNANHELALKRLAARIAPHLFISCSCEVAPFLGEHGRTVATLFNAYVGPLMGQYIEGINQRAREGGLSSDVMFARCVGGCVPPAEVAAAPLYTIDSGPVSGVQGSSVLGPKMGYDNIITTDMGGTTFDVGIVYKGVPMTRNETILDRFEMRLPMIDVVSIGAGGGSIAYIDPASNTMKVGPRSAGAEPGPMCYGKGGEEPTVTDANVVLGIINPDYFLGGQRRLDVLAARRGIERLAGALGLSLENTAAGICRIVDSRMAGEIRRLTLFRGYDPRDFVVFAFGGGGPTHAAMYARELGVKKVAIPLGNAAAAWSALGTFVGGMVHLYERNLYLREPLDVGALNAAYAEMDRQAA